MVKPRGPISIDPDTRDIVSNIYIRQVEQIDGRFGHRVRVVRERQGPDEARAEVSRAPIYTAILSISRVLPSLAATSSRIGRSASAASGASVSA